MVESVYMHFFFVPILPVDKVANLICDECGNKRYGIAFDQSVIPNYAEIKGKFRHPVKTYLVSAIVGIGILASFIKPLFDTKLQPK
ncbi:hypothetical protein GCM10028786_17480 [Flaviaesturariibacter terrae]